jgi:hypothetical protein
MKYCSFLIIIFLIISCDVHDDTDQTNFIYQNDSSHEILFTAYFNSENTGSQRIESFFLLQGEKEEFLQTPENWTGPLGTPPFWGSDSIVTIFDDTLSITYDRGRLDGNPMRIANYELVEGETEPYIYLFEFTNEDYERALERGRVIIPE